MKLPLGEVRVIRERSMKEGVRVAWEKVCRRRHVEFANDRWECPLRAGGDTNPVHLDFTMTCLLSEGWRPSLQKTSPSQQELLLALLDLRLTTACLKFCVSLISKVGSTHRDCLLLQEFWCFSITPAEVSTYSCEPPPQERRKRWQCPP